MSPTLKICTAQNYRTRKMTGVTTNNDPRRIMTGESLFYVEKWPPVIILRRKMTSSRRIMGLTCRINTRGVIIQRVGYRKMTPIEKWPPYIIMVPAKQSATQGSLSPSSVCPSACLSGLSYLACVYIQDLSDGNIYFEYVTLNATFDLLLENFNSAHIFITIRRRAFILGKCVPYDKTFSMIL